VAQGFYDRFVIDDDRARIDFARVHGWLASSYWTPGITRDRVERAAANSALVLGVYDGPEQVAYGRVVSDKARIAYVADIWVDEPYRGRGIGRALVRRMLQDPEFATVRWLLATRDAHTVYAALGFGPLDEPQRWMTIRRPK